MGTRECVRCILAHKTLSELWAVSNFLANRLNTLKLEWWLWLSVRCSDIGSHEHVQWLGSWAGLDPISMVCLSVHVSKPVYSGTGNQAVSKPPTSVLIRLCCCLASPQLNERLLVFLEHIINISSWSQGFQLLWKQVWKCSCEWVKSFKFGRLGHTVHHTAYYSFQQKNIETLGLKGKDQTFPVKNLGKAQWDSPVGFHFRKISQDPLVALRGNRKMDRHTKKIYICRAYSNLIKKCNRRWI